MYNVKLQQVYETLNTGPNGLSKENAKQRLLKNGPNKLDEPKKKSWLVKFLMQFKDMLIYVLLFAAALSITIAILEKSYSELIDAGLILVVVILNAVVSLMQESKADKALEALKNMTKPFAKVIRDGKTIKVKTEEIVVGDIVVLEAGDIVPADLRLVETHSLKIEESSITGESVPTEKNSALIKLEETTNIPLGDQHNMAFMGTVVTYGRGKGVVVACGMDTQMGKIAGAINHQENEPTPLTKRIEKTSKIIGAIVIVISIIIFIIGLLRGDNVVHSFMVAVAIAVCAVPEGLPAALTITLSIGVEQMSKKKAIVKKLPAVETLGSTQVICSDKTGTLTLNKMTVQQVYMLNLKNYVKNISSKEKIAEQDFETLQKNKNFNELIACAMLCNDTEFKYENEVLSTIGDPTETALVHYGFKHHLRKDKFDGAYPRVNEIPFDSERKLMTTFHDKNGGIVSYTKGAVDSLLTKCKFILDNGTPRPITDEDIKEILQVNSIYASHAMRVLGFAMKHSSTPEVNKKQAETELTFIGLAGMIDPPREEVFEAIKTCRTAGILPIMITGDHKDTAYAIAKEIGIAERYEQVITGVELDNISDKDLIEEVNKYRVYARVNPEHKVRIVEAFKAQGKVVAMTGDGVNDAPSLKTANIGVGMGISGTDVTKGVADMVLTDDNFATIVTAVKEGRKIYANFLKILEFLLTTNFAEILLMLTIIAILGREFFSPVLILYINFVTDTAVALALGVERAEPDIMKQPPNKDTGNILVSRIGLNILYVGIIQSVLIIGLYFLSLNGLSLTNAETITMCFVALVFMELFHSYNLRSQKQSIFKIGVFSNKFLNYGFLGSLILTTIVVLIPNTPIQVAMGLVPLTAIEWLITLGFGFAIVPIMELIKLITRIATKKKPKKVAK